MKARMDSKTKIKDINDRSSFQECNGTKLKSPKVIENEAVKLT